jgi:hypothetical protein
MLVEHLYRIYFNDGKNESSGRKMSVSVNWYQEFLSSLLDAGRFFGEKDVHKRPSFGKRNILSALPTVLVALLAC